MAFNLLSQLVNRPLNDEEEDEGSPVDDVDEEIGEERMLNVKEKRTMIVLA